jgi:YVTN family beta-propeller protein
VYVTNRCSLSVIDTVTNEVAPIAVGDLPRCVRISPDGKRAYVSNFGDGSVSVIDTIAQCVTDTVEVGGHPEALAVSPDGHHLYVGDYWSGTVTVLSVQP